MRPSAIDVLITKPLAAPPAIARQAWLDYTWKRGGGLPIVVRTQDEGSGRTVYPLLLKEVLSSDAAVESGQDVAEAIEYKVVSNGLLAGELVPGSHRATVAFLSQPDRTTMLDWRVTFSAKHRPWLWKAVTQQTVGGAAAGLAAYLRPQTARYRLTARLDGCTSASDALDAWSTLTWEGGGLPLPPPLVLSRDKLGPAQSKSFGCRTRSSGSASTWSTANATSQSTAWSIRTAHLARAHAPRSRVFRRGRCCCCAFLVAA